MGQPYLAELLEWFLLKSSYSVLRYFHLLTHWPRGRFGESSVHQSQGRYELCVVCLMKSTDVLSASSVGLPCWNKVQPQLFTRAKKADKTKHVLSLPLPTAVSWVLQSTKIPVSMVAAVQSLTLFFPNFYFAHNGNFRSLFSQHLLWKR